MPRYHYQALNSSGVTFEGMLRADSERDAARLAMGSVRNLPARQVDAQLMIWRRPQR